MIEKYPLKRVGSLPEPKTSRPPIEVPVKNPKKVKMGKKSRAAGLRFETKVRADLESKKWIVFKNTNNVVFEEENE